MSSNNNSDSDSQSESESKHFRAVGSVVFFGVPGFMQRTVTEQAGLRTALDAAVAAATSQLDEAERIVLDAPHGAALVVLANPRGALQAAQRALAITNPEFSVGINHGPVKLGADVHDDALLVGDGIDAAVSAAAFTPVGELMISRSFRDALAESAPELAAKFHRAGSFTDAQVRAHELFSQDAAALRVQNRRLFLLAGLSCTAMIIAGVAAREALQRLVASRQPATLSFDIRPQGDIYINDVLKGHAPGLTYLQLPAGTYRVEVRNGRLPPFTAEVELDPGEQMQLKHSFNLAPPAVPQKRRTLLDKWKFWR